jgi:hypothetical protein
MVGFCEYGNKPLGSIKAGNLLASPATNKFPKEILHHAVN